MRDRWFRMVVTIATSATIACGDEAVDPVTAPNLAARPAVPATNQWPYLWEFSATPTAGSIEISSDAHFDTDYLTFIAEATISFTWSNDVSGKLDAWLLNKQGQTINRSSASMAFQRWALPVPSGDSTVVVQVSTNNTTCGLVGKHSYEGRAATVAIDAKLVQITLFSQAIGATNGPDVLQPACPIPAGCQEVPVYRVSSGITGVPAPTLVCGGIPAPPGGEEEFEVCFTVWRELWIWDYLSRTYNLDTSWLIGAYCYVTTMNAT